MKSSRRYLTLAINLLVAADVLVTSVIRRAMHWAGKGSCTSVAQASSDMWNAQSAAQHLVLGRGVRPSPSLALSLPLGWQVWDRQGP